MLHVTFFTVGDLPRGAMSEIGNDFRTRLQPYVKLEQRILSSAEDLRVPQGDFLIVLDEAGKTMDSQSFAHHIETLENEGRHVSIVLGGPKGLAQEVKERADLRLSLSPMTTTHDLAHLFFLEQLFRAFTILRGKEYHY